jgi:hypothetical protein
MYAPVGFILPHPLLSPRKKQQLNQDNTKTKNTQTQQIIGTTYWHNSKKYKAFLRFDLVCWEISVEV